MVRKKCFVRAVCLAFAVITIFIIIGTSAEAQEQACVFLKPGSGYVAEMRVTSAAWQTPWSSHFDIGQTQCQPLANLKSGAAYTVEVKAILGKTVSCTPLVPYNADFQGNITYLASGTTLGAHCELP